MHKGKDDEFKNDKIGQEEDGTLEGGRIGTTVNRNSLK